MYETDRLLKAFQNVTPEQLAKEEWEHCHDCKHFRNTPHPKGIILHIPYCVVYGIDNPTPLARRCTAKTP